MKTKPTRKTETRQLAWPKIIEIAIFSVVSIFCLAYAMWGSNIAEAHLDLPFLDFPVFIGEILLLACLVAMGIRYKIAPFPLERWHIVLAVYIVWLLMKAFWGYHTFGPLAFRTAALFYYPIFAVLIYYCFPREIFRKNLNLVLFLVLFAILLGGLINDYFLWAYISLLILLAFNSGRRWILPLSCLLIFIFLFRNNFLFMGSRSHIVAHIAAIVFLSIFMTMILIPKRIRVWVAPVAGVLAVLMAIFGSIKLSDPNAVQSMANISKLVERYKEFDRDIQKKKRGYKSPDLSPQIFHANFRPNAARTKDVMEARKEEVMSKLTQVMDNHARQIIDQMKEISREESRASIQQLTEKLQENDRRLMSNARVSLENFGTEIMEMAASQLMKKEESRFDPKEFEALLRQHSRDVLKEFRKQPEQQPQPSSSGSVVLKPQPVAPPNSVSSKLQPSSGASIALKTPEASPTVPLSAKITDQDAESLAAIPEKRLKEFEPAAKQDRAVAVKTFELEEKKALPQRLTGIEEKIQEGIAIFHGQLRTDIEHRSLETAENNIFFRLFIWRDMLEDMKAQRAVAGINFGRPQRSSSIEILDWATTEWRRDGWITPHNSYLHMIYRAGIVGIALIVGLLWLVIHLTRVFLKARSWEGGLLLAALVYWMAIANFLVFLEFPYNAIPFWSLLGGITAYARDLAVRKK